MNKKKSSLLPYLVPLGLGLVLVLAVVVVVIPRSSAGSSAANPAPLGRGTPAASSAAAPTATIRAGACGRPDPFAPPLVTTLSAPSSSLLALDQRRGRVVVVSSSDAMSVTTVSMKMFDETTGALVGARATSTPRVALDAGPAVLSDATTIVLDAATSRVFVLHQPYAQGLSPLGRVDVFDEGTLGLVRSVPVGRIALAPVLDRTTGRVFVASQQSNAIDVLDATSGALVRTTPLPVSGRLSASARPIVDEKTGRVFFAGAGSPGVVAVLDARDGSLLRLVPVAASPESIGLDVGAGRVLAASQGANGPSLSILDARDGSVLHVVALPGVPALDALVVSQTTHRAFISFSDSFKVSTIDTTSGEIKHTLPVRFDFEALGLATPLPQRTPMAGQEAPPTVARVDELRRWVVVTVPALTDDDGATDLYSAQVAVLDSKTGFRVHVVPVQNAWPNAAAVDDGRGRAFVPVVEGFALYDISCLKSYYIFGDIGV